MKLVVVNANPVVKDSTSGSGTTGVPLWDHFLLGRWEVAIDEGVSDSSALSRRAVPFMGDRFELDLGAATAFVRLTIAGMFVDGTTSVKLVEVRQDFAVDNGDLRPIAWNKGPPDRSTEFRVATPPLHPLLRQTGTTVAVDLRFVDITALYRNWHNDSPWFRAFDLLCRRTQKLHVLASLGGHPAVWHVVVPDACATMTSIRPVLMVLPADYGGFTYANSLSGLRSPNHGNTHYEGEAQIQSGLEMLFRLTLEPVSDERYREMLAPYSKLRATFQGDPALIPAPLHSYRNVMRFRPEHDEPLPVPQWWDTPSGLERALDEQRSVLFLPSMNGGMGGVMKQTGLLGLLSNAVGFLHSHTVTLVGRTVETERPTLIAYSQSGGNVFTMAKNNLSSVAGLVLLEPQYVNKSDDDRSLALGRDVIPALIKAGGVVVCVGRNRDNPMKYLPDGKRAGLVLLPDNDNELVLAYPLPIDARTGKYLDVGALHPIIARRYSRLLAADHDGALPLVRRGLDPGLNPNLGEQRPIDTEERLDRVIASMRLAKKTDRDLVIAFFQQKWGPDPAKGKVGYYQHSLSLTAGQDYDHKTDTYRSFIHEGLIVIDRARR